MCFLPLFICYRIFRIYHKQNTIFCEYVVIWMFAVTILLCTLSNTNLLPESLSGKGIDEFRQNYTYFFFIISILCVLSLKMVILLFSPLYLIGQYYFYKQRTVLDTVIYNSVADEIKEQLTDPSTILKTQIALSVV